MKTHEKLLDAAAGVRAMKAKAPDEDCRQLAQSSADLMDACARAIHASCPTEKGVLRDVRSAFGLPEVPSIAANGPLRAAAAGLRRDCIAIMQDPAKRATLVAIAKVLCRAPVSWITDEDRKIVRALTTGDSGLGQAVSLNEPLSEDIYVLLSRYGAFRTLGFTPMDSGVKKFATVSGKPTASWYQASAQGTAIAATASLSGASISPEAATLGSLIEVSGEALVDGAVTFAAALLQAMIEGLAYGIDYAAFRGDGTADTTNGGMTGIFAHEQVPSVAAAPGNLTVASLDPDDFAELIGAVAASAYSHPCRFWIACELLPKLLKIPDENGRLLKPPTGLDDEWRLLGFPVTWVGAGAAPSTEAAGAKVAAFGREDAYTVALRQDFEVASSPAGTGWAKNAYLFRAIARARCLMRDATSLATLKLAAN